MKEKSTEKPKKSKRFDVILICALLTVSLAAVLITLFTRREGDFAVVKIDGVTVMECPLDEDGEYSLLDGSNILVIENGEVFMSRADCPTQTCVKVGKIKYQGQSIVCAPHKITVLIVGTPDGSSVDFVS